MFVLPLVAQGADTVNQNPEMLPYFVLILGLVVGIIGIVVVFGVWNQQRLGIILTIVISLINGLSAAPGLNMAPTEMFRIAAIARVSLSTVINVLCQMKIV